MAQETFSLTMFYKGWDVFHQNIIKIIAPLSAEQMAAPAASHHWTVERVARHIIGNRVWWFQGWMGEGSRDLQTIARWDDDAHPALSAAELVAGLESTWRMVEDALAHWSPADLAQVFPLPSFLSEEERQIFRPYTRQWIIWHVLEHEILHSGELSLALGNAGLTTIYD